MSEAIANPEDKAQPIPDFKRPGDGENVISGEIPNPFDIPLADLNPVSARLFSEDKQWDYFKRLRAEDPVHFNQTELAGRYWSLTGYDEIKQVDSDHHNFFIGPRHYAGVPNRCRTTRRRPQRQYVHCDGPADPRCSA